MRTVLMVAEKPMLAESIANILSNKQATRRKGWNGACSVHEYTGDMLGTAARFKVTSTCGHVMSLDFLPKYNNWERVDPVELFAADVNATVRSQYLSSEARNCDTLVLWLDCDKEGENICFEVVDAVADTMKLAPDLSNVYRAHFSAITDKDIKSAMRNLGRPDKNQALSVDARQELDLRIGCSFTRFQTKYFQGKYGDLDSSLISFGPCQTPTLGFCVQRHDQIHSFKPENYWLVDVTLSVPGGEIAEIRPEFSRGRIFDREVAGLFLERVKGAGSVTVTGVDKKESQRQKPTALNTVELMRVASSSLGLAPAHAMHVAEQLYTQGYISYPRTETTSYPANFDFNSLLRQLSRDKSAACSKVAGELASGRGFKAPRAGDDKGDHPPITPMRPDSDGRLTGDAGRIYDYILRHFLATLMPNSKFWVTTVKMCAGGEEFTVSGKEMIELGFVEVMDWLQADDVAVPPVKRGDTLNIVSGQLLERQTQPPSYLTEAELISLMEKHGIGTDASIPVHINNICQRNYVTVATGRRLEPTKLGVALCRGYWAVDPELVLPTMRAEVETQLNLIAGGKADYRAVTEHTLNCFKAKFIFYVSNISGVDLLFETSFTSLAEAGKPFSRCGKCRRYMKLIEARPQRLHCAECSDTYALPSQRDAVARVYSGGEVKCPLDGFELVYWVIPPPAPQHPMRGRTLCPYCFNNAPFEDMAERYNYCDECTHGSCIHAFSQLGVTKCQAVSSTPTGAVRTCPGVLALDPQSGPPKWRLQCNTCIAYVTLCQKATKLTVLSSRECPSCSAALIEATWKPKETPLAGEATELHGCIFCDSAFTPLVDLSKMGVQAAAGNYRGPSRGRGGPRGGRGGARGAPGNRRRPARGSRRG